MQKVNIPEGESGSWKVEKFTISENEAKFASIRDGYRAPLPGEYTRLMHGREVVMSDTRAEMMDHRKAVNNARGHILINGLGIGMVLLNAMNKEDVERATVIELSADVCNLVAPHYKKMFSDKLEIINADAMTWEPPKDVRYGMVWHDIWTHICADNYEDMKKLHRRFGRKADWQGSWCRGEVKRLVDQDKNWRW